jgi:hypothetical protein
MRTTMNDAQTPLDALGTEKAKPLHFGGVRRLIVTGAEGSRMKCLHRPWRGRRVRTPA